MCSGLVGLRICEGFFFFVTGSAVDCEGPATAGAGRADRVEEVGTAGVDAASSSLSAILRFLLDAVAWDLLRSEARLAARLGGRTPSMISSGRIGAFGLTGPACQASSVTYVQPCAHTRTRLSLVCTVLCDNEQASS